MKGTPTEAVTGHSCGSTSQIGAERAKTNRKNPRGDLLDDAEVFTRPPRHLDHANLDARYPRSIRPPSSPDLPRGFYPLLPGSSRCLPAVFELRSAKVNRMYWGASMRLSMSLTGS